jgi:hypothetical protein
MQNIGNGTIPHVQESQPQGPVDLAALANALVTLQTKVATLETRSSQMDELLAKLDTLSKENEAQRKYIAELEARLSATADSLSGPDTLRETAAPHASAPQSVPAAQPNATANTWTKVVKRNQRKQVTLSPELLARRQAAAARVFQPVSGPQGFEYLYFPRGRKASPTELRKKLRLLGVDTRRVLDICFPARSVVGILVHIQFKDELISCLGKAKIGLIENFDPLAPANLGDPKFANEPEETRAREMMGIHARHCEDALDFLRYPVAVAVARQFLALGWVTDEAVSEILSNKKDAPHRAHADADVADDMSVSSDSKDSQRSRL